MIMLKPSRSADIHFFNFTCTFNRIILTFRLKNIQKVNGEVNLLNKENPINKGIQGKKLNLHALFTKKGNFLCV